MRGPLVLVRWVRGLCGPHIGKRKRGQKVNETLWGLSAGRRVRLAERWVVRPGLAALREAS